MQESGRQERTIKINIVVNRFYEFITDSDRVLFLFFFELASEIYGNVRKEWIFFVACVNYVL